MVLLNIENKPLLLDPMILDLCEIHFKYLCDFSKLLQPFNKINFSQLSMPFLQLKIKTWHSIDFK